MSAVLKPAEAPDMLMAHERDQNPPVQPDATPEREIVMEAAALRRDFVLRRPRRIMQAVRGVDLRLRTGETLALVGESGSGKSTLARMLLGLLEPTSGDVYVFGEPVHKLSRQERAHLVQPVFQDPFSSLNPKKKIAHIVGMPLESLNISAAERQRKVCDMLERVGLPASYAERYPKDMSGGQRQRVAIARALISQPKVVVCDEPTSALDVSVQAQILNLLQEIREKQAVSYLLVTHSMGVVGHLADRVAVMYQGRIVEEGETRSLMTSPRHPYTALLLSAVLTLDPDRKLPEMDDAPPAQSTHTGQGCSFRSRCPRASERCAVEDPIALIRDSGYVACHHPLDTCRGSAP